MRFKSVLWYIGHLLIIEAALMIFPIIVALIYKDDTILAFVIPALACLALGLALSFKRPKQVLRAREGFAIVGLGWIILSLFGCLPFVISQEIPHFYDAFFETVSGFTTTGASILTNIESLSHSMLFWRSFTHFVGGMGVLVFMLAIVPKSDAASFQVMSVESPGPLKGKLFASVKSSALMLYAIYIGLMLLEFIFLICGGMPVFDAIVHSFGTAGTGGFSIYSSSIGYYAVAGYANALYFEIVICVFMGLFGLNFTLIYLLIFKRDFKSVFRDHELRTYLGIVFGAMAILTLNLTLTHTYANAGESLRYASFTVTSIMSSTGYGLGEAGNYVNWPAACQCIIVILMFIGAMAGSTGGGFKVSRLVILVKCLKRDIHNIIYPSSVSVIKVGDTQIDEKVVRSVNGFLFLDILLLASITLILCLTTQGADVLTNFTATLSCISNIGPGLGLVGPMGGFSFYSPFVKILLSFTMLAGRLEFYPIIVLFNHKTWKRA